MTIRAVYIAEDTAGHGVTLGFPRVSTCVAVVAQLPNELAGWHVTTGTMADIESKRSCAQGAAKFIEYSQAGGPPTCVYIVGHVTHHDPKAIRDWINEKLNGALSAYHLDITQHRKAGDQGEYHIFFQHNGVANPGIWFKKSTKTKETLVPGTGDTALPANLSGKLATGYLPVHNRDADFDAKNTHSLRKYFVAV